MAKTMVYPAAMSYLTEITGAITAAGQLGIEMDTRPAAAVATAATALMSAVEDLEAAMAVEDFDDSVEKHMQHCAETLRSGMDAVRSHADTLETLVADAHWPLPKYREMLFIR